ncbi:MAG: hypothetical protein O7A63_10220, partial [Acidobacteria bacterium]|nr:hypothetical protein [Acidobacteriota bacterium]
MISIDGLVSGLDTSRLIREILSLERRPVLLVQGQVQIAQQKQTAFLDLSARLLTLQQSAARLTLPDTFSAVNVNSSSPDALVAGARAGVPPGAYSFRVAQLARASQYTSGGFATADSTPVGAGTLSIELGGGFVDEETELDELNGGTGVARGSVRITDGGGQSAVVDLSTAVTLGDVIRAIGALGLDVTAAVAGTSHTYTGRGLVLEDSGGGDLTVEEVAGGVTASELGILGTATGTLEGSVLRTIGGATQLATLGDGLGIRLGAGDDLRIDDTSGASYTYDLNGLTSVQELLDLINDDVSHGGNIDISVNAEGDGFVVTDSSG